MKPRNAAPPGPAEAELIEAASMIGVRLLAVDHQRSRRERMAYSDRQAHVMTKGHLEALKKSTLFRQLRDLVESVQTQTQREHAPAEALAIAVNFYDYSSMPFRQLELLAFGSAHDRALGIPKARNSEALSRLCLWTPVTITSASPRFGPDSMFGADREGLRCVASSWLDLGLRVPWFEKMLIEALLAAEAFSTVQEFRKNPVFTFGEQGLVRSIVWETIYDRTGGRYPYELLHLVSRPILFVLGATLLGIAAAYSARLVDSDHTVSGYAGLAVSAWIAVNWVGRFVTKRIAFWTRSLSVTLPNDVSRLLLEIVSLASRAAEPDMSLHDLRDGLRRASAVGGVFDQVGRSIIERGIHAGEVRWQQYSYRPISRFDDDVEEILGYYDRTSDEAHES